MDITSTETLASGLPAIIAEDTPPTPAPSALLALAETVRDGLAGESIHVERIDERHDPVVFHVIADGGHYYLSVGVLE